MKFRVLSDLHLEFFMSSGFRFKLPVMEDEGNTVLLLGGDIGCAVKPDTYLPFMKEMSARFKYVVHIAGNHEFYGTSFMTARTQIQKQFNKAGISDNVSIVEREVLEFGDVRVIAATLWADFDGGNPVSMVNCSNFMNDYRMITTLTGDIGSVPRILRPEDTLEDFNKSKSFIFDEVENAKSDGKRIMVMTHHAPSRLSISPQFLDSDANGAFVSDLSKQILDAECDMVWTHGHVHQCHDYTLGKCRVVCNPHGYGNENPDFNPNLIIDL